MNISSSSCSTVTEDENQPPEKVFRPDRSLVQSPPTIRLAIPCTSTGHSICFICKTFCDTYIFSLYSIYIELSVCSSWISTLCHLYSQRLAVNWCNWENQAIKGSSNLNRTLVLELLKQTRDEVLRKENNKLDLNDPASLSSRDCMYYNLTGLEKEQFNDMIKSEINLRPTKPRSISTCITVILTKLRSGLDNQMLATFFNMKKIQISNLSWSLVHINYLL